MSRRALFGAGVLLLVVSLAAGLFLAVRPGTRAVRGDGYSGVIFGHRAAASVLGSMLAIEAHDFWTPSGADVRVLERRLSTHVSREKPELVSTLPEYRRQYFGFLRRDTRRILVVGFCSEVEGIDWRSEFVSTAESAGCHFEAEYDVVAQDISSFWMLED